MNKSKWIWYPGDFERMLFNRCMAHRYEQGMLITPFWRMDGYYSNIKFYRHFTLTRENTLKFFSEGEFNIFIDEIGYVKNFHGELTLPAGEYHMYVLLCNNHGLPALRIEGEELCSDEQFTVSCQDFEYYPVGCWDLGEGDSPNAFHLPTIVKSFVSTEKKEGGVLYDYGKEVVAFLRIVGGKDKKISVSYGESVEEAIDVKHSEQTDEFYPQTEEFVAPITKAFRYVFVQGENDFEVSLLEELSPTKNLSSFTCTDEKLQKIWDAAIRTLELTTREFFIDGPKRDRWSWSGDAILSEWFNYYTFFDSETVKRTIRALGGRLPIKMHINTIMDYTMYWLISLHDYYLYTGDLIFIKEMLPLAKEYVSFCLRRRNEEGFLDNKAGDWVFIDWADMNNEGETSFEQILFSIALKKISVLCKAVGEDGEEYTRLSDELYTRTKAVFYKDGCFRHSRKNGVLGEKVTRYSHIFAVLYDLADEEMRENVKRMLAGDKVQKIVTPYMRFYELLAMCKLGMWEEMNSELKSYWGGMIDEGATTFWEQYDSTKKGAEKYAMYDRPYGKSLCHAWGAAPAYLIAACILGIKPQGTGYQTFLCTPQPDQICDCTLKVPTQAGSIYISKRGGVLEIENTNCGGRVILPKGWKVANDGQNTNVAEVHVPANGRVVLCKEV